jgi:hypothetical protein
MTATLLASQQPSQQQHPALQLAGHCTRHLHRHCCCCAADANALPELLCLLPLLLLLLVVPAAH